MYCADYTVDVRSDDGTRWVRCFDADGVDLQSALFRARLEVSMGAAKRAVRVRDGYNKTVKWS